MKETDKLLQNESNNNGNFQNENVMKYRKNSIKIDEIMAQNVFIKLKIDLTTMIYNTRT